MNSLNQLKHVFNDGLGIPAPTRSLKSFKVDNSV